MKPLDTWTPLPGWGDSHWQQSEWGEYRQLDLLNLTPTPNKSYPPTSPTSRSPQISEPTYYRQNLPCRINELKKVRNLLTPHFFYS